MEKSTWWIGLSEDWTVVHRTSWDAPRPDFNSEVHLWIKKQETDELVRNPNMKGTMIYDYSVWNSSFRKREFFPIHKWSIVGITTPRDWKICKNIYIHLQDPLKTIKKILVDSDTNWNLTKAFTKIDYKISIFDSWEDYENQKS